MTDDNSGEVDRPGVVPVERPLRERRQRSAAAKTWKREFAAVAMAGWVWMMFKIFWHLNPDQVKPYEDMVIGLTWAIFLFVATMVGATMVQQGGIGNILPKK